MGTGGSTQLSPLDFFLRSTRVSVPSKLYRRQMEHFSWQNLAVNVSQSPARFALGSWDVFAYDLLPNRLSPLGQVSSGQRQPIALRFPLALLERFRTLAPLPIGYTPTGFASWLGYASQALGILVRVGCTPCGASTPRLSTSSSLRCLTGLLREKLHLRAGFTLRCFQRLSFPDAATQLHGWRHDWYTVGPSTPVLSY